MKWGDPDPAQESRSPSAVASLICSGISFAFGPLRFTPGIGYLLSACDFFAPPGFLPLLSLLGFLPGIVLGCHAKWRIYRNDSAVGFRMASTGVVLGYLSLLFWYLRIAPILFGTTLASVGMAVLLAIGFVHLITAESRAARHVLVLLGVAVLIMSLLVCALLQSRKQAREDRALDRLHQMGMEESLKEPD